MLLTRHEPLQHLLTYSFHTTNQTLYKNHVQKPPWQACSYSMSIWWKTSGGGTDSSGRHSSKTTTSSWPTVHRPFVVKFQHVRLMQQFTTPRQSTLTYSQLLHDDSIINITLSITVIITSYFVTKIEQGLTSHQTHYRSYLGRIFTGQMIRPTLSKHWRKIWF